MPMTKRSVCMKNLLSVIFIIGLSFCSYGQMDKNGLIGHWKVKRIIKKSSNPELRGVMDGFKHATFSFLENGHFNLRTESKAPAFKMILIMIENSKWKFDTEAQLIKIGAEEDGYSIMGIYPIRKKSSIEFQMDQSEMNFEMERVP